MLFFLLLYIKKIFSFYYIEVGYRDTTYFVLVMHLDYYSSSSFSIEGYLLRLDCENNIEDSGYNRFNAEFNAKKENPNNYQKLSITRVNSNEQGHIQFKFEAKELCLTVVFPYYSITEDSSDIQPETIYQINNSNVSKLTCLDMTVFRDDKAFIEKFFNQAKDLYNSSKVPPSFSDENSYVMVKIVLVGVLIVFVVIGVFTLQNKKRKKRVGK